VAFTQGTIRVVEKPAEFVVDAYHRLWHIEKSFRMSKHDLQARPIYARKRDSIEAHLKWCSPPSPSPLALIN
jgi:hypothetical protein